MTDRPEFIVLTGPLGSGKTTLLSDHLSFADTSDTGVLVNDAGEVNIDGAVIGADHRNLALATLDGGCICCSLGNDLQEGIDALLLSRAERQLGPPRRIILETSGLAEPAPIVRSLRAIRQVAFDVRIVATLDASAPFVGDNFLPHYAAQLAAAQTIVMTKLDRLSPQDWNRCTAEAQGFNPLAAQVVTDQPRERALSAFSAHGDRSAPGTARFSAIAASASRITVAFAEWKPNASWAAISEWIENLAGFFGSRLLRLKGLVRPDGQPDPVLINGVGDAFSPPRRMRLDDDVGLGLTLILRDVAVDELFQPFCGENQPVVRVR
ncbi:GTP-binding protein [Bosea sp. CRIB-10]|uniref:CobW family GTP-binding protein n=1 Tax=Bosea sp. CRIB-10 TaxID=378404 RepID=UPI0015878AD8|nr:GTP-binding protein [Bosea sp. CRIB-10]